MKDIDYYKSEIDRYKNMIADEAEKEEAKEFAESLHKIYAALLEAGFSEDQAWFITKQLLNQALYD